MKRLSLPPYHLFSYGGMQFVCDVHTGRFLRVDTSTTAFLEKLNEGKDTDDAVHELSAHYGAERCAGIAREVVHLRQLGLLSEAVYAPDRQDFERQVARLLRMHTGNINLYLAEACNMRCKYCYVGDNNALGNTHLLRPECTT